MGWIGVRRCERRGAEGGYALQGLQLTLFWHRGDGSPKEVQGEFWWFPDS